MQSSTNALMKKGILKPSGEISKDKINLVGEGGALVYIKVIKPKQSLKGGTDLDELDFDEDNGDVYQPEDDEEQKTECIPIKQDALASIHVILHSNMYL
ncbi:MAG: hypothetical protein RR063_11245 [Anaerovoracaceae bacterium]